MRAKYYAIRTEEAYLGWIRRFILFSGKRHPSEMGGREVARFLSHLANQGEVAPSTQNQAFSALLFLYKDFLEKPLDDLGPVTRASRPRKVPVVLTKAEVKRLLLQLEGVELWIFAAKSLSVDPRTGAVRRHHVDEITVQRMVKRAAAEAGLAKLVTPPRWRRTGQVGAGALWARRPCGTPSRRIFWRTGTTFARCRNCSGTRMSPQR